MNGHGDDVIWDGLACPPLEDYAFNFDNDLMLHDSLLEDDLFDNPLLDIEEDEELDKMVAACLANPPTPSSRLSDDFPHLPAMFTVSDQITKANVGIHPYGKGKVLKILARVLPLEKHSKTTFYCQTEQPKDRSRLDCTDMASMDNTNQVLVVANRRNADYNFQPMQRKDIDHMNQCTVGKKRKADYNSKPMQQKNMSRLDQTNQTGVVENKRIADYESRFEASRQMLHEAYKQAGEAKQRTRIQVIDFQIPETQQPGSKGKAKGKPSLRQKLMATGTRKSNKKLPSYKMLSSCN